MLAVKRRPSLRRRQTEIREEDRCRSWISRIWKVWRCQSHMTFYLQIKGTGIRCRQKKSMKRRTLNMPPKRSKSSLAAFQEPDNSLPPKTMKRHRRAFPTVSLSVPNAGNGYGCKTDAVEHDGCRGGRQADKERFFQRCAGVYEPVRRQGLNMHGRSRVPAHPQGRS